MRAILIDSESKEVKEVDLIGDNVDAMRSYLNCTGLELVRLVRTDPAVDMYIDEEFRLKDNICNGLKIEGCPDVIMGNGLIVGTDVWSGKMVETNLLVSNVEEIVTFVERK